MNALVLEDYKRFSLKDVPQPSVGTDEVLVRIAVCGICGSDVHGMDGSTGRRRPPIIMGHEACGAIAEVGSSVRNWRPGDRVTFDSTIYCGECSFCKAGQINLCENRRVLGVSCEDYRQNGAFAEFVTLPARVLYKVPTDLKLEYAALIEPFSIALHAISRVQIDKVQTAFVAGAGMIGLATVQMLQAKGVKTIFCADVIDERLAVAKQCGATIINSRAADPAKVITEQTEGVGADCVFEAVGLSQTVEMAIRSVRKGGSVVLVGNVSPRTDFPLQSVVTREVSLFGSCASRGEYPECLDMMSQGVLSPDLLISAIAPLSEGAAWFERLYKKDPNLIKVLLKP